MPTELVETLGHGVVGAGVARVEGQRTEAVTESSVQVSIPLPVHQGLGAVTAHGTHNQQQYQGN